jgi:hypothetical protein
MPAHPRFDSKRGVSLAKRVPVVLDIGVRPVAVSFEKSPDSGGEEVTDQVVLPRGRVGQAPRCPAGARGSPLPHQVEVNGNFTPEACC